MSALETLAGQLTVGELAAKAGISISTLIARLDDEQPAPQPQRSTSSSPKKSKIAVSSRSKIGLLTRPLERERFDASILAVLDANDHALKIDEILKALPWSNVNRDQVSRAMPRLRDAGKISASGNTQARLYELVRKPKN